MTADPEDAESILVCMLELGRPRFSALDIYQRSWLYGDYIWRRPRDWFGIRRPMSVLVRDGYSWDVESNDHLNFEWDKAGKLYIWHHWEVADDDNSHSRVLRVR